jgi:DNA-directed RNA polymerase subunit F
LREEDLERLAREGKLQETLKELKRLSESWNKMATKHKSILASYASIRPATTDSMEAIIEKEKELTTTFEKDIKQIEEYLARKGRLE